MQKSVHVIQKISGGSLLSIPTLEYLKSPKNLQDDSELTQTHKKSEEKGSKSQRALIVDVSGGLAHLLPNRIPSNEPNFDSASRKNSDSSDCSPSSNFAKNKSDDLKLPALSSSPVVNKKSSFASSPLLKPISSNSPIANTPRKSSLSTNTPNVKPRTFVVHDNNNNTKHKQISDKQEPNKNNTKVRVPSYLAPTIAVLQAQKEKKLADENAPRFSFGQGKRKVNSFLDWKSKEHEKHKELEREQQQRFPDEGSHSTKQESESAVAAHKPHNATTNYFFSEKAKNENSKSDQPGEPEPIEKDKDSGNNQIYRSTVGFIHEKKSNFFKNDALHQENNSPTNNEQSTNDSIKFSHNPQNSLTHHLSEPLAHRIKVINGKKIPLLILKEKPKEEPKVIRSRKFDAKIVEEVFEKTLEASKEPEDQERVSTFKLFMSSGDTFTEQEKNLMVFKTDNVNFFELNTEATINSYMGSPTTKKHAGNGPEEVSTPTLKPRVVMAKFNEQNRVVQPDFMQEKGSMCFTEFWGDRQKNAYFTKLKNDIKLVNVAEDNSLSQWDSVYRPERIKDIKKVSNKIIQQNHRVWGEYNDVKVKKYKRFVGQVDSPRRQTIYYSTESSRQKATDTPFESLSPLRTNFSEKTLRLKDLGSQRRTSMWKMHSSVFGFSSEEIQNAKTEDDVREPLSQMNTERSQGISVEGMSPLRDQIIRPRHSVSEDENAILNKNSISHTNDAFNSPSKTQNKASDLYKTFNNGFMGKGSKADYKAASAFNKELLKIFGNENSSSDET